MIVRVVSNSWIKGSCYKLVIDVPGNIISRPGQFLMLRPIDAACDLNVQTAPLLSRPFSIHRFTPDHHLQILYKVVGKGTSLLTHFNIGSKIEVLGPLGNGFSLDNNEISDDIFIVAGGIGVAPLVSLAELLRSRYPKIRIISFLGGGGEEDLLCVNDLQAVSDEVILSTNDGSYGYHGYVTESVEKYLESVRRQTMRTPSIYACGPTPMLQRITEFAAPLKLRTWFSLEASMACGIGLCMGCAVKANNGGYYLVCTDGPVFRGDEIAF